LMRFVGKTDISYRIRPAPPAILHNISIRTYLDKAGFLVHIRIFYDIIRNMVTCPIYDDLYDKYLMSDLPALSAGS
jgi:hypothetical protein